MSSVPVLPCRVRAVYSWAGEEPSDLGFIEGDYIDVLDTGDGDWYKGRLRRNKLVGYFPRNYVQFCDKNQRTVPHPEQIAQLAIGEEFHKSTQDILADITLEMNQFHYEAPQSEPEYELEYESDNSSAVAPPPPPPHLVNSASTFYSCQDEFDPLDDCPYANGHRTHIETKVQDGETMITEQGERDLLRPIGSSPVIDEVPFNLSLPKERMPAQSSHRTLSGRSQSFDLGPVTKTKGLVRKLLRGIVDNKELWRSNSMTDIRQPPPKLGNLKFWNKEEEADDVPEVSASSAAAKALLDPHWMGTAQDLYRVKTLSKHEISKRKSRLELDGINVANPFAPLDRDDAERYEYYLENFDRVDDFIMQMETWPALWTPAVLASSKIGRQFSDPVHQARGVFMLCATHISWLPAGEGPDGSDAPAALSRVMQQKRANSFELAHVVESMCSALDIPNKVVRGHFRASTGESFPHAWNAVSIEQEWYLMDASVASDTFPGSQENEINTFYFLTPPAKMIFTHVPNNPQDQFLERPITTSNAVSLPIAAPGAFRDKVEFIDYWNGLRYMHDLEPCEFLLAMPGNSLDIVAEVKTDSVGSLSGSLSASLSSSVAKQAPTLALSQPFWQEGQRLFRVKAVLPHDQHKATLNIYTVERHLERRSPSNMVLAYSLNLIHKGCSAPFEFVSRFAHPRAPSQDLYVVEPQCKTLKGGQNYKFCLRSYASRGPSASNGLTPVKVAVQSPSGRITKLSPDHFDECIEWKMQVRTLEVGCWRGVVCDDAEEGWTPFAEWYCT